MKMNLKKTSNITPQSQEQTPQDFIGLESIQDGFAVHKNGTIICILEVTPINVDLLNDTEQDRFAAMQAQARNSPTQPFQIFSIGRSADLQEYHAQLNDFAATADIRRRQVLNQLMIEAKKITISGDVMERRHYILLRQPASQNAVQQVLERANILSNRLTSTGTATRICTREDIISLYMLFADPSSDSSMLMVDSENYRFA
jgi:hypothetical protein